MKMEYWEKLEKLEEKKRKKLNYRDNSKNIQCCLNCSHFLWDHDEEYTCKKLMMENEHFQSAGYVDALTICDEWEREWDIEEEEELR
mgnify:CR=1 FL=1